VGPKGVATRWSVRAMEREGYEIETLAITATLPAADLIIVAGPQRPFAEEEARKLAGYVEGGGSLMVLVDPLVEHGLETVLLPWEIRPHDDLVFDPQNALFINRPSWIRVVDTGYGFHTITKDLEQLASLMPNVRSIGLGTPVTDTLKTTALLKTSDGAWGEVDLENLQGEGARAERGENDEQGPLTLAVAAEGGEDYGRLVVFGTSALVVDPFLRDVRGIANLDLFLNAVNWLTQEEELISIRPTEPDDRPLTPPENPLRLMLVTAVLAPLAVLGVGGWIMLRRRSGGRVG